VFGPVVMLGDGGKYIEALPDVSLLLPPFAKTEALAALKRLRIAPILAGVRGEPALDVDALAEAALRLAAIITGARGQIAAIDLHPVMVSAHGQGITVLDALIERRQG
jgi:acetate---CoA ligase (ADP-forming)